MKRNKKLFQLYATSLSSENVQNSTVAPTPADSPTSPTRSSSEVSSNDSNRMSSPTMNQRPSCISPPTISTTFIGSHNNNRMINPHMTTCPDSNNISNLLPYAPTTISNLPFVNPTTANCSIPRPPHLHKLSPHSPLIKPSQPLNNFQTNFPNLSPTSHNSNTTISSKHASLCNAFPNNGTTTTTIIRNQHDKIQIVEQENLLYRKLWHHLDSNTKNSGSTNTNKMMIQKQHKTTTTRRTKISISELLC